MICKLGTQDWENTNYSKILMRETLKWGLLKRIMRMSKVTAQVLRDEIREREGRKTKNLISWIREEALKRT